MKKGAINIFVYSDGHYITSLGYKIYENNWGTETEAYALLQLKASLDYDNAVHCQLKPAITKEEFSLIKRAGELPILLERNHIPFEEIPYCLTHIVNGKPRIDDVSFDDNPHTKETLFSPPDYLTTYLTKDGFDFPKLIDDDFISPIRLLFNNKKYISSLKLLLSAVDTLSFVEYGHCNGSFIKWIDEYCDLTILNVTSAELWELRNGLMHMTNLESHKVRSGEVKRLVPYIGPLKKTKMPFLSDQAKYFHFTKFLIEVVPKGIGNWLRTYNEKREKFPIFFNRYDSITSEARVTYFGENTPQ